MRSGWFDRRARGWSAARRRRASIAAGALALAFGGIVLARASAAPTQVGAGGSQEAPSRIAISTPELSGFVAFTQGAVLASGTRELFAELRLSANEVPGTPARRPVALAIALDTSGSMSGEKIVQARDAVRALVTQMRSEDRVAIVTYESEARYLTSLQPVGRVLPMLDALLAQVQAGGGTDIPRGLALAGSALSEAPPAMVRRLVLVSDGQDGSGQPLEVVSASVVARAQGGTTTSALGVGTDYDERWLTTVADAGRGNYQFLAGGAQLATFLRRELDQASATSADLAQLELSLPPGWRIAEAYGASVPPGSAQVPLGALFGGIERRVTLRLEAPAGAAGTAADTAVGLRYVATASGEPRSYALGRLRVRVVSDEAEVAASRDVVLHAEAVAQHLDAQQALAVDAWREGRVAEAQRMAQDNFAQLRQLREQAPAAQAELDARLEATSADLDNFRRVSAQSQEGRAYGLQSNSARHGRSRAAVAPRGTGEDPLAGMDGL